MERSSRFISLWVSGIAAGICALVGAWFAKQKLDDYYVILIMEDTRIVAFIS